MSFKNKAKVFCCLVFVIAGCSSTPPVVYEHSLNKFDYALAEADNGFRYTLPYFYEKLYLTNFMKKGGIVDEETVSKMIDSAIIDTLMGLRADTVDLPSYYEDYFRYREATINLLVNTYYEHVIFYNVIADSIEVVEYIEQHPEEFTLEEQVYVSHLLSSIRGLKRSADSLKYKNMSEEELDEIARQRSLALRDSINSKENFEEFAKKYSHDLGSGARGGVVGWAKRNNFSVPFDSVAFSAKPGDIVGPYRDKDGWQILYIDNYIPPGVPPLNPSLFNDGLYHVQMEKTREIAKSIFDTLMDDIHIIYNEDALDSNVYTMDKREWAAIVNETDTIDFGVLRTGEESIRKKYGVSNSTVEMKKELIDYMSRRLVIIQQAREMGLDSIPEVRDKIDEFWHKNARNVVYAKRSNLGWEPSQELMREYYDAHLEKYVVEKPIKVQQIVVSERKLAEFIRDQANSGMDFLQLAEQYYPGEESVRVELANLGWIGPEDVSKEFFDVANVTTVGRVSAPVKTEYGYHIIKVLDRNMTVPFDKARAKIRNDLKDQKISRDIAEFEKGLRQEFNLVRTGKAHALHFKPLEQRSLNLTL